MTGYQDSMVDQNGNPLDETLDLKSRLTLEQSIWNHLFADPIPTRLRNHTNDFVVEWIESGDFGDAAIGLTVGYTLRLFPSGRAREFWRFFRGDDLDSHFVVPFEKP